MKYAVTITKVGFDLIEAETVEQARDTAAALESEGAFKMDMEIVVEELE